MKKVILFFILSLNTLLSTSYTFAYDGEGVDFEYANNLSSKIEDVISKKGENYRSIFIDKLKKLLELKYSEKIKFIISLTIDNINSMDLKDLGSGFNLIHTDGISSLKYNGNYVYKWSNVIKNIPFIDGEGCNELGIKYDEITKDGGKFNNWQEVWDSFGYEGQRKCMIEFYNKAISLNKTHNNKFFNIIEQGYESYNSFILYDIERLKSYNLSEYIYDGNIKKIEVGSNGIYIIHNGDRGNNNGLLFINNKNDNISLIFSNAGNDYDEEKTIENFELMENKQIKVTYKRGESSVIYEKVININKANKAKYGNNL